MIWLLLISAYLIGAIPFGFCFGKLRGVDLREHGSGNIGATNAGRVLGKSYGFLVFALDFLKGLGPVLFARYWVLERSFFGSQTNVAVLCAVATVLGHVFPVTLKFRGGKGVATAAGAFCGLDPFSALAALLVWVLVLAMTRWVALASVVGAWSFPITFAMLHPQSFLQDQLAVTLISAAVAILITLRHRANFRRMLRGEEPKVGVFRSS